MLSSNEWIYESPWFFENYSILNVEYSLCTYMIAIESRIDRIGFRRAHTLIILFCNLLISSLFWHNDDELGRFINATDKINTQNNVTF